MNTKLRREEVTKTWRKILPKICGKPYLSHVLRQFFNQHVHPSYKIMSNYELGRMIKYAPKNYQFFRRTTRNGTEYILIKK